MTEHAMALSQRIQIAFSLPALEVLSELNGSEFRVFLVIWSHHFSLMGKSLPLSTHQMSDILGLKRQQIQRALKVLVSKGLVKRTLVAGCESTFTASLPGISLSSFSSLGGHPTVFTAPSWLVAGYWSRDGDLIRPIHKKGWEISKLKAFLWVCAMRYRLVTDEFTIKDIQAGSVRSKDLPFPKFKAAVNTLREAFLNISRERDPETGKLWLRVNDEMKQVRFSICLQKVEEWEDLMMLIEEEALEPSRLVAAEPSDDEDNLSIDDAGKSVNDAGESADDAGESINDAGESADDAGQSIDDAGMSIDDTGKSADDAGVSVDDASHLSINDAGKSADDTGKSIDDAGKSADDAGHIYNAREFCSVVLSYIKNKQNTVAVTEGRFPVELINGQEVKCRLDEAIEFLGNHRELAIAEGKSDPFTRGKGAYCRNLRKLAMTKGVGYGIDGKHGLDISVYVDYVNEREKEQSAEKLKMQMRAFLEYDGKAVLIRDQDTGDEIYTVTGLKDEYLVLIQPATGRELQANEQSEMRRLATLKVGLELVDKSEIGTISPPPRCSQGVEDEGWNESSDTLDREEVFVWLESLLELGGDVQFETREGSKVELKRVAGDYLITITDGNLKAFEGSAMVYEVLMDSNLWVDGQKQMVPGFLRSSDEQDDSLRLAKNG